MGCLYIMEELHTYKKRQQHFKKLSAQGMKVKRVTFRCGFVININLLL